MKVCKIKMYVSWVKMAGGGGMGPGGVLKIFPSSIKRWGEILSKLFSSHLFTLCINQLAHIFFSLWGRARC